MTRYPSAEPGVIPRNSPPPDRPTPSPGNDPARFKLVYQPGKPS
jgi:hypothetical protein